MPRGGARAGAGRKPMFGRKSKLARVPEDWSPEDIKRIVTITSELKESCDKTMQLLVDLKALLRTK